MVLPRSKGRCGRCTAMVPGVHKSASECPENMGEASFQKVFPVFSNPFPTGGTCRPSHQAEHWLL